MANLPIISVLTPTWNRAGTFLAETIRFIQKQHETGFTHEHVIVDNASEDNTEEIVRGFMKDDPRIKYIRNDKNLYASGALNVAFAHSVGEIIVPFDDDDIMPALSLQARFDSLRNPKVQWSSGHAFFMDYDRRLRGPDSRFFEYASNARPYLDENNELKDPEGFFLSFFRKWMVCGGTVTIRRHCIEQVGGWEPTYQTSQDNDMWVKLAHARFHYKLANDYLFFYREHQQQSSLRNAQNGGWKQVGAHIREKYGITDEILAAAGITKGGIGQS